MKKRSVRLKVVLELAERNEKAGLEQLSLARRYLDDQLGQIASLKQYHEQYMNDMRQGVGHVHNVAHLQSNLHFMNQIDLAIQQQQAVSDQAQKNFDLRLQQWTDLHQKKKGLEDLIKKYKDEEQLELDKQEQKQMEDAFQARMYRRD